MTIREVKEVHGDRLRSLLINDNATTVRYYPDKDTIKPISTNRKICPAIKSAIRQIDEFYDDCNLLKSYIQSMAAKIGMLDLWTNNNMIIYKDQFKIIKGSRAGNTDRWIESTDEEQPFKLLHWKVGSGRKIFLDESTANQNGELSFISGLNFSDLSLFTIENGLKLMIDESIFKDESDRTYQHLCEDIQDFNSQVQKRTIELFFKYREYTVNPDDWSIKWGGFRDK